MQVDLEDPYSLILISSPCALRAGIRFRPVCLRISNGVYILLWCIYCRHYI